MYGISGTSGNRKKENGSKTKGISNRKHAAIVIREA
jgi:hypothetical protein